LSAGAKIAHGKQKVWEEIPILY